MKNDELDRTAGIVIIGLLGIISLFTFLGSL